MAIQSFSCADTHALFTTGRCPRFANIKKVAERKLAQLDAAFGHVATRDGEVERLHAPVYAMVTDFKSALYRDFPDPERVVQ